MWTIGYEEGFEEERGGTPLQRREGVKSPAM
jgi:hypothetical protein